MFRYLAEFSKLKDESLLTTKNQTPSDDKSMETDEDDNNKDNNNNTNTPTDEDEDNSKETCKMENTEVYTCSVYYTVILYCNTLRYTHNYSV